MYLDIHFCIQYEVVNLAKEKIDSLWASDASFEFPLMKTRTEDISSLLMWKDI